ncbi:CAP domain-containing protein [Nocardia sp. NPDC004568]|uniref:CAP domain-containing protein n=1 Tax=Nocardia sp. NPDC004568 TaxID=3154551 RepID=UPI0033A89E5B
MRRPRSRRAAVAAHADAFADRAPALHNQHRADYGAAPPQWDATLAAETQQWAHRCGFTHSQAGGRYGENPYAGGGENVTVDRAVLNGSSPSAERRSPARSAPRRTRVRVPEALG